LASWEAQPVICIVMEWEGAAKAAGCAASTRIADMRLAMSVRAREFFALMG